MLCKGLLQENKIGVRTDKTIQQRKLKTAIMDMDI